MLTVPNSERHKMSFLVTSDNGYQCFHTLLSFVEIKTVIIRHFEFTILKQLWLYCFNHVHILITRKKLYQLFIAHGKLSNLYSRLR